MKKIMVFICACAYSFITCNVAYAFKVDTHIWIGQQVLNDIADDGSVTINVNGLDRSYAVEASLVNAIINNPSQYRMGNVGPDGFPDIITGQTVVHPGAISWKTDDWLKWVVSGAQTNQERAFAYGYLSHAAADVFAHTYVNHYSGDRFEFKDGESDVEARHILLEQYISKHTPPLKDNQDIAIGAPYDAIQVPTSYVFNRLIMNPTVTSLYGEAGLEHLKKIYDMRQKLQEFVDGPLNELENQVIVYLIGLELPDGVTVVLTDDVIQKAKEIYNDEFLSKYSTQALANIAIDGTQEVVDATIDAIIDLYNNNPDQLNLLSNSILQYIDLNAQLLDLTSQLASKSDKLFVTPGTLVYELFDIVERAVCDDGFGNITLLHRELTSSEQGAYQDAFNVVMTPNGYPIIWNDMQQSDQIDEIINSYGRDGYSLVGIVDDVNKSMIQQTAIDQTKLALELIFDSTKYSIKTKSSLFSNDTQSKSCAGDIASCFFGDCSDPCGGDIGGIALVTFACPSCAATAGTSAAVKNIGKTILDEIKSASDYCLAFPTFCASYEVSTELFCTVDRVLERTGLTEPVINPEKVALEEAIEELNTVLIPGVQSALNDVRTEVNDITGNAFGAALDGLVFTNDIVNNTIDWTQEITMTDINPLRAYLEGWISDIDTAMLAYVDMNASVIGETMKPGGDALQPVTDWFGCEFFKIVGVPGEIVNTGCIIENRLDSLNGLYNDLWNLVNPAGYVFDFVLDELQAELEQQLLEELAQKAQIDIEEFIQLLQQDPTDELLNLAFTERTGISPTTGEQVKSLLVLDDIAQRVATEMQLTTDGYFDPVAYSVIYNSVIMSKLSLLDAAQINRLAQDAGVGAATIYSEGIPIYSNNVMTNVLYESIKSIDGNHQWMHIAPPYPRQISQPDLSSDNYRNYGYIYNGTDGFRLWQDPVLREQLFLNIFKGPLVPGIDAPELIGFDPVLYSDYPYRVCSSNPYPKSVYDNTCIGGSDDEDGMDDSWELQMIGNILQGPNDDPDMDGVSNIQEYLNGTDPLQ